MADRSPDKRESLVKRLRSLRAAGHYGLSVDLCDEAADALERTPSHARENAVLVVDDPGAIASAAMVRLADEANARWRHECATPAASAPSTTPRSEPVAWRYRYHYGAASENKGMWKYADTEDECNHTAYYEREPLYASAVSATRERAALAAIASDLPQGERLLNACLEGLGLEPCKGTYAPKPNSFSSRWQCECGGNIGNCPAQKRAADGGKQTHG